jgi:glutamate 5-kinase
LPVGVVAVDGSFGKGDVVSLCDRDGIEFARGLTNYSSADAQRIRGMATEQIEKAIGKIPYVELVHRDNLHVVR